MMVAVFTVFFGRLAGLPSASLPYPLFVLAGLLPWLFFAAAVSTAGNSVVASERLVTKIYFPRLAIPFAAVGVAAVDFCVAVGMLGRVDGLVRGLARCRHPAGDTDRCGDRPRGTGVRNRARGAERPVSGTSAT